MAGTMRRHSSALEGEVSRTPRAAAWDSSYALKVSRTPGAAWHSSNDWNCEETQFRPGGRGILDPSSCCSGQQLCPEGVPETWKLSDFSGKSDQELLQQEGCPDCSGESACTWYDGGWILRMIWRSCSSPEELLQLSLAQPPAS
ncbi:hypothetical protein STEG23_035786 [Scotinomys teguina]